MPEKAFSHLRLKTAISQMESAANENICSSRSVGEYLNRFAFDFGNREGNFTATTIDDSWLEKYFSVRFFFASVIKFRGIKVGMENAESSRNESVYLAMLLGNLRRWKNFLWIQHSKQTAQSLNQKQRMLDLFININDVKDRLGNRVQATVRRESFI